ncbi:MAG: DUF5107 domain-containing protein [Bacteroidales bacterium]|nr:DUF5107 domain-containing protein [Bacteroidales bacterium]
MKKRLILVIALALAGPFAFGASQGRATLTKGKTSMLTYGFSDPDPVANPNLLQYPYFRFDGFATCGVQKEWDTVTLENEWISVTVFPQIGGKVWGATDKTRGLEFIYYNHVVKFRDIAMRGAWTSGGIEFNFGIIGHVPSTATPVDYCTRENPDGSVSCIIASYELLTRTWWTVEINVPADKAYFTTRADYVNTYPLEQPYYNWSNAAFKAGGRLQTCLPGDRYIGHGGDPHAYPVDPQGRDLSWYANNAFGEDKSIHVLGEQAGFFGAYWHDDAFGYAHVARPDEKLGRKFFCWSHARQGAIWEDLLTDSDGQYVEMQAGRMFNQPFQKESIGTPFKHNSIAPAASDTWNEYWFPVEGIGAFQAASRFGALGISRDAGGTATVRISPVVGGVRRVVVSNGEQELFSGDVSFSPLVPWSCEVPGSGHLHVCVGAHELEYDENPSSRLTERPDRMPEDFDWASAQGHCIRGEQYLNVRFYEEAVKEFEASLAVDPWYAPALRGMASLSLHCGWYERAFDCAGKALRINTYDGEANYLYGLAARALGKKVQARDGFSVATYSSLWQRPAYVELARSALADGDWALALECAAKSQGPMAELVRIAALRHLSDKDAAAHLLASQRARLPLFPFWNYEYCLLEGTPDAFMRTLKCELPHETLLEMALWYLDSGLYDEALSLSSQTEYATARYLRAYIYGLKGDDARAEALLREAEAVSPDFVFPFRPEMLKVLDWAAARRPDWKTDYYRALIQWRYAGKEQAKALLDGIGSAPDYNPFYLTRAKLRTGAARLSDLLKAESLSQDWRTGKALVDYYAQAGAWEKACEAGQRYFRMYPEKFEFGLAYADALCGAKEYQKALKVLSGLRVMPKEGARKGHQIYRKACLGKAKAELRAGKFAACIKSVEASKIWDERLGAGKPYEELIDYTEENAILKAARERNRNAFSEK